MKYTTKFQQKGFKNQKMGKKNKGEEVIDEPKKFELREDLRKKYLEQFETDLGKPIKVTDKVTDEKIKELWEIQRYKITFKRKL